MRRSIVLLAVPLLVACGSEAPAGSTGGAGAGPMQLAPPPVGMQIATTAYKLDTGAEEYQCWSFQVPEGEAIALTGLDTQIPTSGVHHYGIFTDSNPIKEAGPYECKAMGVSWRLVSGGGVGTPGVKFPQGTAMPLPAGQHIIFQLHLLNASGAAMTVEPAYINLIGTKDTNYQKVGLLIAGTANITIPAHGTGVTAQGGCTLTDPLPNVFSVFPHMHQLGKRITAEIDPSGGGAPVTVADQQWNFRDQGLYAVKGVSAAAGDKVQVTCYYDNPTDKDVGFGLSSNDEMCVNVLYYYPATKPSQSCGLGG